MFATDVNLSRDKAPVFPNRCVVCLQDEPDAKVSLSDRSGKLMSFFSPLLYFFGKKSTVDVPCCSTCRGAFRLQRWGRKAVMWVMLIAAGGVAWQFRDSVEGRGLRKLALVGIAIVALAPFIVWEVFRPPYFDITANSKDVDYEFQSEAYAHEFATLNGVEFEKD